MDQFGGDFDNADYNDDDDDNDDYDENEVMKKLRIGRQPPLTSGGRTWHHSLWSA